MSLIRAKQRERLISLREAARRLSLSKESVRQKRCGTESLTHVWQGKKIYLIESEVEAHLERLIDDNSERQYGKPLRVVAGNM